MLARLAGAGHRKEIAMAVRTLLALAAIGGMITASPVIAAPDQTNPALTAAPDQHGRCDPKTHLDDAGAPCKDKVGEEKGAGRVSSGGGTTTWVLGALGVAALAGLVTGLSSKNPASP
ncbi:hypothetical protein AQZ49_07510 [Novosphingobium sp. FSW06-99]|nr:hypothetical protein AQZ49_07510 [Novosphingobium sp. FSW06-99]